MTAEESSILEEAARLFTNLGDDSTKEEVTIAYKKELELLERLQEINPELAEECGISYSRALATN